MALMRQTRQCSFYASYAYGYATRFAGRSQATRLSSSM
jgi:hypothetical protein